VIRILLVSLVLATGATAAERDDTLAALGSIAPRGDDIGLSVQVQGGTAQGIPIGAPLSYRIRAARDAEVTVLHVDPHGVVTLLIPSAALGDGHIAAGSDRVIPEPGGGIELSAEPPVGLETIFVVATETPLDTAGLGLDAGSELHIIDPKRGPAFARSLAKRVAGLSDSTIAVARAEQRILGRPEGTQYRSADIVDYFTTRTRSIERPRLDLQIQFGVNSATLDGEARADLAAFGSALANPRMESMRFVLSGHTDDTGAPDYNLELSRERAERARTFLVEVQGIEASRVEIQAYGETRPKEPNATNTGRQMNRRVEFELLP
jgi:outer membrane protein OmpA-like peptidoglycan-associated protein